MTLTDALLALERAGGGLTIRPTGIALFVPTVATNGRDGWAQTSMKRRSDDTYETLIVRGIEKALGKEG